MPLLPRAPPSPPRTTSLRQRHARNVRLRRWPTLHPTSHRHVNSSSHTRIGSPIYGRGTASTIRWRAGVCSRHFTSTCPQSEDPLENHVTRSTASAYSSWRCRKMFEGYHTLASLLAFTLGKPPPSTIDLIKTAAEKLEDKNLLRLHKGVATALSLTYAIDKPRDYKTTTKIRDFTTPNNVEEIHTAAHKSLLLYSSDTSGHALGQHRRHAQSVAAAHHSNAYTQALQAIAPTLVHIPRCRKHSSNAIRANYTCHTRLQNLPTYAKVCAGYTYGVELHICPSSKLKIKHDTCRWCQVHLIST